MRTLFDNVEAAAVPAPPTVRAIAPMVRVTEAYDAWWGFAYERQQIYYRRLRGEAAPWTDDPTLSRYRFTNSYRAADRVSQYLIKEVIYVEDLPQTANEVVFRILLFKFFNRIETWEALTSQLGSVALADDPFARIDEILSGEFAAGRHIYSAAYIMPTWRSRNISARKHQTHLALLREMMADCLGDRLADAPTMKAAFEAASLLSNDRRFPRLPVHHRYQLQRHCGLLRNGICSRWPRCPRGVAKVFRRRRGTVG